MQRTMTTRPDPSEVMIEQRGELGLIRLNRPRAINALTHGMIAVVSDALAAWREDPSIATVAIAGEGGRGLCAGSDVVSWHRDVVDGDGAEAARFWRDQFALNVMIDEYPKPYVAIQDGIVLGGGVGISAHGSHRIVTERTRIGFPETNIGYVPDVGASWLLSRAPGNAGLRLGLTAEHAGPADAIALGLSDVFVRSARIADLLSALEEADVGGVIREFAEPAPDGLITQQSDEVEAAFDGPTVEAIVARLRAIGDADARALADAIDVKSPLALAAALESIRRGRTLSSLRQALVQEYRTSRHAATTFDFVEGIRAQLVDKDRSPSWNPPTHGSVTRDQVLAYFEQPTDGDLGIGR